MGGDADYRSCVFCGRKLTALITHSTRQHDRAVRCGALRGGASSPVKMKPMGRKECNVEDAYLGVPVVCGEIHRQGAAPLAAVLVQEFQHLVARYKNKTTRSIDRTDEVIVRRRAPA